MVSKIVMRFLFALLLGATLTFPVFAFMPTAIIGDGNIVKLEVASTPDEIKRGLMYRTSLAADAGMVFLFYPHSKVKFWMYHTLIPLDMCFVLRGRIVKIFEGVPPCRSEDPNGCVTYPADGEGIDVSEVVELPAGYIKKHGIREGDTISFKLSR